MKYIKKPLVIDAVKWNGSNIDEVQLTLGIVEVQQELCSDELIIPTLEGNMIASKGDYVIKGIKGEFYPCKPDIFEASYDLTE